MAFLDYYGLQYFYGKLKETPIPLAENLVNKEITMFPGSFTYRTSGGGKGIDSGDAYLYSIKGNMKIIDKTAENFTISSPNNIIDASVDADAWILPSAGTYNFYYSPPDFQNVYTAGQNFTQAGTWSYDASTGMSDLTYYGISTSVQPVSLTVESEDENLDVTVYPSSFCSNMSNFTIGETYQFYYNDGQWEHNSTAISTTALGLNIVGEPENGSQFNITTTGTPSGQLDIVYTPSSFGSIIIPKPTELISTGFNQFNSSESNLIINNATIANGSIVNSESDSDYVVGCRVVEGPDLGYMVYSPYQHINEIGFCSSFPSIGTAVNQDVTDTDIRTRNNSSIKFKGQGYIVVAANYYGDLCIHPRWDIEADNRYEFYSTPSVIAIPSIDISGTVTLPVATYGLPAIGTVADEIDFVNKQYIQRIGTVSYADRSQVTTDSRTDGTTVYYVLSDPLTYALDSSLDYKYTVNNYGTEEFANAEIPVNAKLGYVENLRNKIKNDVLTVSERAEQLSENNIETAMWNLGWVEAPRWQD